MTVGDYDVTYDTDNKTFVASENTGNDVEVLCKAVTELSTQYVFDSSTWTFVQQQTGVLASDGDPYAYGVEYTCELGDNDSKTFYVLETSGDNVSLIMNMNIDDKGKGTTSGNTVAWCKSGSDNSCAADGAIEYLSSSTVSWTKLNPNQISLPSEEQIYQSYSGSMPTWLYENLNSSIVPDGYWTSTPYESHSGSDGARIVELLGELNYNSVDSVRGVGVRPVITISKTQLG